MLSKILQRKFEHFNAIKSMINWLKKIAALPEESLQLLRQTQNEVIDHVVVGNYELYLVHFAPANIYQVAIQRTGLDFTNIEQQKQKQDMKSEILSDWQNIEQLKDILLKWKSKYGDLVVKSHSQSKDDKYFRILQWLGLNPRQTNQFGPTVVVI